MTSLSQTNSRVDAVHRYLATLPPAEVPVTHRFAPGCYAREMLLPKGVMAISKIHKTEHFFVVLSGKLSVWDAENGVQQVSAGHIGITKPGTRRIGFAHEDCRWVTFHPTDKLDVDDIEAEIIEPYEVSTGGHLSEDIMRALTGGQS
jgi:quercetin dioxygenase-like cupin family protein